MRGEAGQEQEERLEKKKNRNKIAAEAVSKSTGKVTTIPFGDDDDDHSAIPGAQPKESNACFQAKCFPFNGLFVRNCERF